MADCSLSIPYGIPSDGANEYAIQSGRELFRCGLDCIKMFITNVTLETKHVSFKCGDITGALSGNDVCIQSINASWKDKLVVNWIGKTGAHSGMTNGTVINKVNDCVNGKIYTHTEGTVGAKAQFDVTIWNTDTAKTLATDALNKLLGVDANAGLAQLGPDMIFSDLSTNVSQTDWQGGSCNYQLFGIRNGAGGIDQGYSISFNYQNGQAQITESSTSYDETDNCIDVSEIVDLLLP